MLDTERGGGECGEKVKSLFEDVKGGDVVCTADYPTCREHYVHNEESTLDDAPQKMKRLRTIIQNIDQLKHV